MLTVDIPVLLWDSYKREEDKQLPSKWLIEDLFMCRSLVHTSGNMVIKHGRECLQIR